MGHLNDPKYLKKKASKIIYRAMKDERHSNYGNPADRKYILRAISQLKLGFAMLSLAHEREPSIDGKLSLKKAMSMVRFSVFRFEHAEQQANREFTITSVDISQLPHDVAEMVETFSDPLLAHECICKDTTDKVNVETEDPINRLCLELGMLIDGSRHTFECLDNKLQMRRKLHILKAVDCIACLTTTETGTGSASTEEDKSDVDTVALKPEQAEEGSTEISEEGSV